MSRSTTQERPEPALDKSDLYHPKLHHVGFVTTRREEMLDWYGKVLGMEVTLEPNSIPGTFVSNDGAHHRLGFFQFPGTKEDTDKLSHARVQHIAFEYPDIDTLLASWERIAASGIEHVSAVDHGTSFSIYYKDPDANTIELECDAFATAEQAMEHMRESQQMKENPMGLPVDPAKLIAARRDGLTLEELSQRAMAGLYQPDVLPDPFAAA
jgi:catechol 2,3-dioxygenase